MDLSNISKFGNLESAMSMKWAVVLLATTAFIDCYLVLFHQMNIFSLSIGWLNTNFELHDAVLLILMFSLSFGLIIPGASFIFKCFVKVLFVKLGMGAERRNRAHESPDYISFERYRRWAIQNSNSAAYKDYESQVAERDEMEFSRFMCRCCILLIAASFLISRIHAGGHISAIEEIYNITDSFNWFFTYPLRLVIGCLALFMVGIGFQGDDEYRDLIRLESHGIKP